MQSNENFEIVNGNSVFGETEVVYADGSTGIAGDIGFEFLENQQAEASVIDGVTTTASALETDLLSDEELDRMIVQANSDAAMLSDEMAVPEADTNPDSVVINTVDDDELVAA